MTRFKIITKTIYYCKLQLTDHKCKKKKQFFLQNRNCVQEHSNVTIKIISE